MSIAVPVDELAEALAAYPWGYLVTVGDDQRARSLAVPTVLENGRLWCPAGERTRACAAARSSVTMLFPPRQGTEFSLIVDGDATVTDEGVWVQPTWAVRHRPALQQ
jgi:hypothetical protein